MNYTGILWMIMMLIVCIMQVQHSSQVSSRKQLRSSHKNKNSKSNRDKNDPVSNSATGHNATHSIPFDRIAATKGNSSIVSDNIQYVQCSSRKGRIDHYYHFFFACFVPIIIHHTNHLESPLVLCNSPIGSFSKMLQTVVPAVVNISQSCPKGAKNELKLTPFDGNRGSDVKKLSYTLRNKVLLYLQSKLVVPQTMELDQVPNVKVLLIGRGSRNQTNSSSKVDPRHRSGADRRTIRNFDVLEGVFSDYFGDETFLSVYWEDHSIADQFALIRGAQVIIGQHGAGLSNIFFMANSSRAKGVIEISPYSNSHRLGKYTVSLPDCFKDLAESLHIPYIRITQPGEFSDVDSQLVLQAARKLLQT